MSYCRVCDAPLGTPVFHTKGPVLVSALSQWLDVPATVYICRSCSHGQSPNIPDIQTYYDREYRFSLESEDFDQIYEVLDGVTIYRTEHQAKLLIETGIAHGANVLDFGSAKARTLQRLVDERPDISPYVFDVSEDYKDHWLSWVPVGQQATYDLPEAWKGKFDLITAHFVFEHLENPVAVLKGLVPFLREGGRVFISVPDPISNMGDLLVGDHLSHFVPSSLHTLLQRAGFKPISIRQDLFWGGHVVLAEIGAIQAVVESDYATLADLAERWSAALNQVSAVLNGAEGETVAIYGAGFYGAMFARSGKANIRCFLDQNKHLQGSTLQGVPILPPESCPPVDLVIAALNPARARAILPPDVAWLPRGARVIYPGEPNQGA